MNIHTQDKALLVSILIVFLGGVAYGFSYDNLGIALGIGSLLLIASYATAAISQGNMGSVLGLPIIGMCMVALLIHVAKGHSEAHFAVFAFLAAVTVHRRWEAVIAAAATIAVHHLSFNFFQQWGWGPICFTEPNFMRVIEHAAYVVAESGILIMLTIQAHRSFAANEELTQIANSIVDKNGNINFAVAHLAAKNDTTHNLQKALLHMETALIQVKSGAESIGTASSEIASGSADLSSRTEQTASSLQETASSMDELTSNVGNSAESARQANQLASSASITAKRGGAVVMEVVTAMSDIHASSKKISDIIGTIDGIAFQTNILALNAAVEAARAGEQGRGFAVVASEVRQLAQRSAAAAREIKVLIGNSVDRVEAGSRLVKNAGDTMEEVVASVQRVSDIIGEITTASSEQSTSIGQINHAVTGLDQMTQQNAALVEQSAAAAESLKDQAAKLTQVVSAFHLQRA